MAKFFIVIDMQNDFITGSLANPAAAKTIPFIKEQIQQYKEKGYQVIFTRDSHSEDYLETGEGKHLPVKHCIMYTKGWEIVPELMEETDENTLFIDKLHFGYDDWAEFIKEGDEVVMCGTVGSICVAANVSMLKAIENVEVTVLKDGVSDLSDEMKDAALKVMAAQQAKII